MYDDERVSSIYYKYKNCMSVTLSIINKINVLYNNTDSDNT